MGERAKFFINEYSALHLLEKDNIDLDKFYNADLKVMVETAKKEIKRLNNIIKEVRKYIEEYRGDCPYSEYKVDVLDEPEKLLEILDKEKE